MEKCVIANIKYSIGGEILIIKVSFMHYFNFQSFLQWNSFKKQSTLVNLPISIYQQDKTFFFLS